MLRINVLDQNNNRVGEGPLQGVVRIEDRLPLDEINTAEFTVMAGASTSALITAGRKFDLYDPEGDGYLGRFYYAGRSLEGDFLTVKLMGEAVELTRLTVGFRRTFNNVSVTSALTTLAGLAGWTVSAESQFSSTRTILSLEGESPYRGIDELRDRFGHFRFAANRLLEFGDFGQSSGVRLINLGGVVQGDLAADTSIAIIKSMRFVEESEEIFNCVIPLGTGHGEGVQLTIRAADAGGDYAVQSAANADGTLYYYIWDAGSVTAYGARWKVLSFPQIRPLDNSETARARAALALKLTAETYMNKHLGPKQTFEIGEVYGLRQTVRPGDLVRVTYRGVVDGYGYFSVDADYWVNEISRSRTSNGSRTVKFTISNSGEKRTSDTDIVLGIQRDIRALKVHIPANPTLDRVTQVVRLKPGVGGAFDVNIGDETQSLLYAILRFKTLPLQSDVETAVGESTSSGPSTTSTAGQSTNSSSSGGGQVVNADTGTETTVIQVYKNIDNDGSGALLPLGIRFTGGAGGALYYDASSGDTLTVNMGSVQTGDKHTHRFNIASHAHPIPHQHGIEHEHNFVPNVNLSYGLFEDTVYPGGVSVLINGTDRTATLGGPWGSASGETTAAVSITDILNNASGGVQQRHTIEFRCASGYGRIEAEVHMLASIQAITSF